MIQGDHEDAPGQIELNFNFDRAERTADNLSTYRQICRQVGRELNVFPCFMPKPFMGVSANGCHHNISLWRGDENAFMPETDDQRLPSQVGLWAIGGILEHLGALTAITSPTVNSYRRLWDTGFWAPVFADWGFQNRTTALRVSAPGPVRVPLGRLRREPVPLDGRADHGDVGRDRAQARPGRAGGAEHLRCDGGGQGGQEDPDDLRRRARRARGRRGRSRRRCPARCTTCSCTTSATSGSASAPPSPTGTSTSTSTSCRDRQARDRIAHVWDRRNHLQGRRASDRDGHDPDAPVDEAPRPGLDRLRALRPAVGPRDHAVQARRREHAARLRVRGPAAPAPRRGRARLACARRPHPRARGGDRVRVPGHARLRRRPEAARRLRRGRARRRGALARPLARDRQGPRRRRDGRGRLPPERLHRHPRDRPRPDGDRVRRRHLRRPPLLGVSRSPTSPSSTTAS